MSHRALPIQFGMLSNEELQQSLKVRCVIKTHWY